MARYRVRLIPAGQILAAITANDGFLVTATSPDEAMTMIEREGYDYVEAEVSDADTDQQLAVYGPKDSSDV